MGSLRNNDSGGNENGKTAIGLDWESNNFASRFFVHFLAVNARLRRDNATIFEGWTQDNNFPFLFLNFDAVLCNSTPKKNCQNLTT